MAFPLSFTSSASPCTLHPIFPDPSTPFSPLTVHWSLLTHTHSHRMETQRVTERFLRFYETGSACRFFFITDYKLIGPYVIVNMN